MPALSTTKLRRTFGALVAVDGLDLEVAEGEIFGLVGPDGAGKTTTMRMLAGILPPTTSALLHNASTLAISLKSMTNLLPAAAV